MPTARRWRARASAARHPAGEQAIDRLETERTSDRDGSSRPTPPTTLLEAHARHRPRLGPARRRRADHPPAHDRARRAPARDLTITGRAVDLTGAPVPTWSASPVTRATTRPTAFATTGPDGGFTLGGLDRDGYDLDADAEDRARDAHPRRQPRRGPDARRRLPLAGQVVDGHGDAASAFTCSCSGALARRLVVERSLVSPASSRCASPATTTSTRRPRAGRAEPADPRAGATDIKLALSAGATRGSVVDAADGKPIGYARVMRET